MPRVSFPTTFGSCAVSWNEVGLTRFELPEARRELTDATELPAEIIELVERVEQHLEGAPRDFADVPYDFSVVSEFQRDVYRAALAVKSGHTRSYGEIATVLGLPPGGARAVGAALGDNPWPLLVPCHRFIGATGKMTGFSAPGGIRTKLRLLALEGSQLFAEG